MCHYKSQISDPESTCCKPQKLSLETRRFYAPCGKAQQKPESTSLLKDMYLKTSGRPSPLLCYRPIFQNPELLTQLLLDPTHSQLREHITFKKSVLFEMDTRLLCYRMHYRRAHADSWLESLTGNKYTHTHKKLPEVFIY